MRVKILSRASDLARLQALLVGRALHARWPDVEPLYLTRSSTGDRDGVTPLASLPTKGAFTADLTDALASGEADVVVHSWKDLPLEGRPETTLVATLERADPRDVLLVRRAAVSEQPRILTVLSSSPRRTWLLERALPGLLPWPVDAIRCEPVRGNIPTRLRKLVEGKAHGLVVAKAALDRLLGFGAPFEAAAAELRRAIDQCHWMVLPLRDVPGAPAQGAVAVEAKAGHTAIHERFAAINHTPTWNAVMAERDVMAAHGGGCHEAVGATVLGRDFGSVMSVRAKGRNAAHADERWALIGGGPKPPAASPALVWPRPDEAREVTRSPLAVVEPAESWGYWVARADALPHNWNPSPDRLVWTAGGRSWRRLAARGVWVHGCADSLGDQESPAADLLAGRAVQWLRLTHANAVEMDAGQALATYEVNEMLPADLPARTHFFWTSGRLLREALTRWPSLHDRWHGSGPGRTHRALREAIQSPSRVGIWLDYEQWYEEVIA